MNVNIGKNCEMQIILTAKDINVGCHENKPETRNKMFWDTRCDIFGHPLLFNTLADPRGRGLGTPLGPISFNFILDQFSGGGGSAKIIGSHFHLGDWSPPPPPPPGGNSRIFVPAEKS